MATKREDPLETIRLEAVARADEEVRVAVVDTTYDHDELTIRHGRRLHRRGSGISGTANIRHNTFMAKAL